MTVEIPARAVSAPPSQGGGSGSIADGVLRTSDERVGLVPNITTEQRAAMQAALDIMGTRAVDTGDDRVVEFGVGAFRKSGGLNYVPTSGHRSMTVRGQGSHAGKQAPTAIIDIADAGDLAWALQASGPLVEYEVRDMSLFGLGPSVVYGMPGWAMHGLLANGKGTVRDMAITGYQEAVGVTGDHQTIENIVAAGNVYGLNFFPGGTSQGDIVARKYQGDGCAKAGIGVAAGRALAGFRMYDGSLGQAPYCIHRYPVVGAPAVSGAWLAGCGFYGVAIEFPGNGVCYDEVQDGAGIDDIDWDSSVSDWGLFSSAREWVYGGTSKPKVASWFTTGGISNFRIARGFPGLTGGLPSFKAANITNLLAPNSGAFVLPKLKAGERAFEVISNSAYLDGCLIGGPGGIKIKPYRLAAGQTLARGECAVMNNEKDVKRLTAAGGEVVGIATQPCDGSVQATRVACLLKGGNSSDTEVKNASGAQIPSNTYITPDFATAGVKAIPGNDLAAAKAAGLQILGRTTGTIADGALGAAHIFDMAA